MLDQRWVGVTWWSAALLMLVAVGCTAPAPSGTWEGAVDCLPDRPNGGGGTVTLQMAPEQEPLGRLAAEGWLREDDFGWEFHVRMELVDVFSDGEGGALGVILGGCEDAADPPDDSRCYCDAMRLVPEGDELALTLEFAFIPSDWGPLVVDCDGNLSMVEP
ncbi:MAG: hypothetical protein H6739_18435 [Alphaproteobacteria bacterium]|nr:hypothetical protein [Alphaproteobacteria bacterium]